MYYEEQQINGRWYWRGHPDGEWTLFDESKLHSKLLDLESENKILRNEVDDLRAFNDAMRVLVAKLAQMFGITH